MTRGVVVARLVAGLAALAVFVALVDAIGGGFDYHVGELEISSHDYRRPLIAGIGLLLAAALVAWRTGFTKVLRVDEADRLTSWAAGVLSAIVLIVGLQNSSFTAGGADSSGYVSQAHLWLNGQLRVELPSLVTRVPWPDATWTFSPLGYRPSAEPGSLVPTYAAGLPLTMAAFMVVGGWRSAYLVVPVAGAIAVWLTFVLGRQVAGKLAGVGASILLATSSIFLLQLFQPMSDVPATTWWLATFVLLLKGTPRHALLAGLTTSAALLTRPNLVLVAAVAGLFSGLLIRDSTRRERMRGWLAFLIGCLPGALIVAILHTALYGSPLMSGYGSMSYLYSTANAWPNLLRYPRWLIAHQTPLVLIALAAPVAAWRAAASPRDAMKLWLLIAWFAALFASYLFYYPFGFQDWTYLRFLLPGLPAVLVLTMAVLLVFTAQRPAWVRPLVLSLAIGLTSIATLRIAVAHDVFSVERRERRYQDVARFVRNTLSPRVVLVSMQESGSLSHYTGRLVFRWDLLGSDWFDRAVRTLADEGYESIFVLESSEEPEFRRRFTGELGRLDWPPAARYRGPVPVNLYRPADRARFLSGRTVSTAAIPSTGAWMAPAPSAEGEP
jgi:hypothetical protein